jgi:hypothetical protein
MKPDDLRALRTPLLVLLAVLAAGAGAIYYTEALTVSAAQQLERQRAELQAARTRLQKSGEEREIIVRYLDAFRRLERAGFVGEEQRINWLDALRLSNQEAKLFGVDYQVSAQAPYLFAGAFDPGKIRLNHSQMRLRFRLLHEEDLMRFFRILAGHGTGLFTIDECRLRRLDTRGVIRFQPNVLAECELSWITAKVPRQGEPK